MPMALHTRFPALFITCLIILAFEASADTSGSSYSLNHICPPSDLSTLQLFRNAVGELEGMLGTSWTGSNCCTWLGVYCSRHGVIELDLSSLDHQFGSLNNKPGIGAILGKLTHLRSLNLFGVFINQSIVQDLSSNLRHLQHLNLSRTSILPPWNFQTAYFRDSLVSLALDFNDLGENLSTDLCSLLNLRSLTLSSGITSDSSTATIPPCLGTDLPFLEKLDLSNNKFHGTIPSSFRNSEMLQTLKLRHNNLEGSTQILCDLPALREIDLTGNNFHGEIASCLGFSLPYLQHLRLRHNRLEGSLPIEIGDIKHLVTLDVGNNFLNGGIPASLGYLQSLEVLDLSQNPGITGNIPAALGDCKQLVSLRLGGSEEEPSMIEGTIPISFGKLSNLVSLVITNAPFLKGSFPNSLTICNNLQALVISGTSISGPIPYSISNWQNLNFLDLRSNHLSGAIPSTITDMGQLQDIFIDSNSLSGWIPKNMGSLQQLNVISLSDNHLQGPIPHTLGDIPNLLSLNLSNNFLEGSIPPSLGRFSTSNRMLDLSHNRLSGKFPIELCNFNHVSVSYNQITHLPSEIEASGSLNDINYIHALILDFNYISGHIPQWLTNLSSLVILSMAGNRLEGPIPSWISIQSFPALQVLDLSRNRLSSSLPRIPLFPKVDLHDNLLSGSVRFAFHFSNSSFNPRVVTLDLSNNRFSGELLEGWKADRSILLSLEALSLAHNNFSGEIPDLIGCDMTLLTSLDLSYNRFQGLIPESMVGLPLSSLALSHNELTGEIPKPWSHWNASSFGGNAGLCGSPLPSCVHKS